VELAYSALWIEVGHLFFVSRHYTTKEITLMLLGVICVQVWCEMRNDHDQSRVNGQRNEIEHMITIRMTRVT